MASFNYSENGLPYYFPRIFLWEFWRSEQIPFLRNQYEGSVDYRSQSNGGEGILPSIQTFDAMPPKSAFGQMPRRIAGFHPSTDGYATPNTSFRQMDEMSTGSSSFYENNLQHFHSHSAQLTDKCHPNRGISQHPSRGHKITSVPSVWYCTFCHSNGETSEYYTGHQLKDGDNNVTCPILQKYVCCFCGATGKQAHTKKYCPRNPDPLPISKPIRRNAIGKPVVSYN